MKTAVFYGRYSSDRQTEQSIEGQRRVCQEFAQSEDIRIVGEYVDRATSGTSTDHREQFQKMISDSKSSNWDYVLVYKLDRFARNRYDSAVYKRELKRNGVRVLSATERITDSPEGILIEGLLESMDEYFSRELSRKCKRGIRETIIKGYNFTRPPYGYKKVDRHFVIDDTAADNVRRIFRMYISGATLQSIADTLNAEGHRTNQGNVFQRYTISDILHNDKYTGTHYIAGIDEPETCPAIVSEETFNLAKSRLEKFAHNARKHKNGHVFALTGLIKCGECGCTVVGTSVQRKYFYYTCIARNCKPYPHNHALNVNAENVESSVIQALQGYFTEDRVDELAERLYKIYIAQDVEKPNNKNRLMEVEKQIQGAVAALIACPESEALQSRLQELEQQKREIQSVPTEQPRLTKKDFANFFRWLSLTLECAEDRKTFFNTIVHSATLYKDHVVIAINMTDENADPPARVELEKYFSDSVGNKSRKPCPNCTMVKPMSSKSCAICTAPQRSKAISLM